jgi:SAM-dependent methyltransferase
MLRNRLFDWRYGVETRLVTGLAEQGVSAAQAAEGNNIYRPIWISEFRHFMRAIDVDPRKFTFVDFGSGKGKMLLLAAEFGFPKIFGVEYAPGLHAVAVDNLNKFKKSSKCRSSITAMHGDARDFELPPDPLVIMMFNPFGAEITRAVIAQIENDYRKYPREMYLLYANRRNVAEIGDAFANLHVFKPVKASRRVLLFHAGSAGARGPRRT